MVTHTIRDPFTGWSKSYEGIELKDAMEKFRLWENVRIANGYIHPLDPSFDPDLRPKEN
jgi:hypothetical protein